MAYNLKLVKNQKNSFFVTLYNTVQKFFFFLFGNKLNKLRARFTKQWKLAREHNSKAVPIGLEMSAGDYWQRTN